MKLELQSISILGVSVTVENEDKILEYIITRLLSRKEKAYIATPNPEIIVRATKDFSFKTILNHADVALPDGVGVVWAAKMLQNARLTRIAGANFVENLCEKVAKKPITIGLLGAGPGVAQKAAKCLLQKYPGLKVMFAGEEWPGEEKIDARDLKLNSRIDLLFVAFGAPKQEEWIARNLPTLPVTVAMAVGGTFDYLSGIVPRAPRFLQSLGLEWLFRLIVQPWRIKRQLVLLEFVYLVLKEKFQKGSLP